MSGAPEKPRVAIMIGDPVGVGPEILVRALAEGAFQADCRAILIGSVDVLRNADRICGTGLSFDAVPPGSELPPESSDPRLFCVVDDGELTANSTRPGLVSAESGRAAYRWFMAATTLANRKAVEAVLILPIDSGSLKAAGLSLDKAHSEPEGSYQLRISGALRVVPITEHVPMRDVASFVRRDRILTVVELLAKQLKAWGIAAPRIAVAGLNPHAMFEEDAEEVRPAVEAAVAKGIDAVGPVTPDAVFRQAMDGAYDGVVTMYHDQGQIALKTAAFEGACTVFIGLPAIRVGIPHGSALDIAGTGKAQHYSVLAALQTIAALLTGRAPGRDPTLMAAQ